VSPTYDGADDTLIGVLNLSSQKIASIPLHGPNIIFGFDGDGVCATFIQPHDAACPFGPTGYEGPGVSFSNISADKTSGTVNFSPPIAANGGTAYFGLELAIQTQCPAINPPQPLKQTDPTWKDTTLGPPATSTTTIGNFGCFLTDLAMEINYYAQRQNKTFRTDPLKLNKFLIDNGGFTSDASPLIPFAKLPLIATYAKNNGVTMFYGGLIDHRDDFTLDQFLCHGFPPMLYVGNPHWVFATGQATHNGNLTFSDIDPDDWPNGDTLDNAAWNNTYGGMVLFSDLVGPLQGLYVTAHSPVELLLTAPDGSQTGFNPLTNTIVHLIPSSAYLINQLIDDETHGPPLTPELKELAVFGPSGGQYTLQVISTGNGPYTIDITAYDNAGTQQVQSFTGTAATGVTSQFKIGYSSTPGVALTVVPVDTIPPTTVASLNPLPNTNGWNRSDVTVTLTATDEPGGSGVKQISFAGNGAQIVPQQTIPGNTASVVISSEGITTLTYSATDNAGNVEKQKMVVVRLDKTAPVILGLPKSNCTLWPPNHKFVQVADVTASDALSGLLPNTFVLTGTSSEPADPTNPDITIASDASGGFTVQLRAERLGSGIGRTYTLTAAATDLAGNTTSNTATCMVPHDQGQ